MFCPFRYHIIVFDGSFPTLGWPHWGRGSWLSCFSLVYDLCTVWYGLFDFPLGDIGKTNPLVETQRVRLRFNSSVSCQFTVRPTLVFLVGCWAVNRQPLKRQSKCVADDILFLFILQKKYILEFHGIHMRCKDVFSLINKNKKEMSSAVVSIVFVALWVCCTAYVKSVIASTALTNIFFLFLPGSCHRKMAGLGRTWLYCWSQNLGLTNKRHEVTRNECQ